MDSLKHKLHRDSEQHRTENVRIMQVGGAPAQRCVHIAFPLSLLTQHSQTLCCCERDGGPVQAPDAAGACSLEAVNG